MTYLCISCANLVFIFNCCLLIFCFAHVYRRLSWLPTSFWAYSIIVLYCTLLQRWNVIWIDIVVIIYKLLYAWTTVKFCCLHMLAGNCLIPINVVCCWLSLLSQTEQLQIFLFYKSAVYFCQPFVLVYLYIFSSKVFVICCHTFELLLLIVVETFHNLVTNETVNNGITVYTVGFNIYFFF